MPLPTELSKIKDSLEARERRAREGALTPLSQKERALLSELQQLDKHLNRVMLNEIQANVTKMTGPGGNVCGCCGHPL